MFRSRVRILQMAPIKPKFIVIIDFYVTTFQYKHKHLQIKLGTNLARRKELSIYHFPTSCARLI